MQKVKISPTVSISTVQCNIKLFVKLKLGGGGRSGRWQHAQMQLIRTVIIETTKESEQFKTKKQLKELGVHNPDVKYLNAYCRSAFHVEAGCW